MRPKCGYVVMMQFVLAHFSITVELTLAHFKTPERVVQEIKYFRNCMLG